MASVYVTKRVNVYPKTIMHPTKIMKLTNLDRQCPTLMYLVLFYKPCHKNFNNDCVFNSLKLSLEETLSRWYPAAGRLIKNPNNGNKLDLWCNNGGAVMVEAVTPTTISELGNLSQYNDFFENLVYKPVCNHGNIAKMPLLVAQVTKFGCGGYSVGIGTSHALFDGKATFNFLSAWASCNNNKSSSSSSSVLLVDDQCHKPVHERHTLLHLITTTNNTSKTTSNNNNNNSSSSTQSLTKVAAIQHLYQLMTQAAPSMPIMMNPQLYVPSSIDDDIVLRTFHLTSSMLDTLKRRAYGHGGRNNNYSSSSSCSSFDIVSAHLWKARTRALGVRKDRTVCLQYAVDTRTRITPQLSQGFSGNAYVLASVALTAGQLDLASHDTVVDMIKTAKNSVDNHYVAAYMEALEASGDNAALPPLKGLTIVSDWTRMPFHNINFNSKHSHNNNNNNNVVAVSACPLNPLIPQVAYFMQSHKEDKGSIDVRIGLSSQILAAFSHYFLNIFT